MQLSAHPESEDGLGLVEVILAFFILGLIAVALLPLLWRGLQIAAEQSTVTSATRLLNDTIEQVRAVAADPGSGCAAAELSKAATDGRGVELLARAAVTGNSHASVPVGSEPRTVLRSSGCTAFTAPGSLTVEVIVTRVADGAELARATTIIFVPSPPEEEP